MQTLQEALIYIRNNSKPGDWVLKNGCIRSAPTATDPDGCRCPVCWIGTMLGHNTNDFREIGFGQVAYELGLNFADAITIAHAADYMPTLWGTCELSQAVRTDLLEACHLMAA